MQLTTILLLLLSLLPTGESKRSLIQLKDPQNQLLLLSTTRKSRYNIDLIVVLNHLQNKTLHSEVLLPIRRAQKRLERAITNNLPSKFNYTRPCRNDPLTQLPNTTQVDDLLVFIIPSLSTSFANGGPCFLSKDGYSRVGSVGVNLNFFVELQTPPFNPLNPRLFEDIITHEILHVIGIGTLWNHLVDPKRPLQPTRYIGPGGLDGYRTNLRGTGDVELETHFQQMGEHFDECAYDDELMSPVVSYQNYLSPMTCGALRDLNYTVNMTHCDPLWKLPRRVPCNRDGYRLEAQEHKIDLRGDTLRDYIITDPDS